MDIRKLRIKTEKTLLKYLDSKPKKKYTGYYLWGDERPICRALNNGWVYVIYAKNENRVKIGHTGWNPIDRARKIFTHQAGAELYVTGFSCSYSLAHAVESYVQSILYCGGLQSVERCIGGIYPNSGGTEIFNINPKIACAMVDEAANEWEIK